MSTPARSGEAGLEMVRYYRFLGVSGQMVQAYCAPSAEQAWLQRRRAARRS